MSINEQRIREFAYQIWESEGKPHGHTGRHWEMASKLAHTHSLSANESLHEMQQTASTETAPSVEPIEPISPTQPAQPVPPSDPIQPTDPVQPGQPVQPGSPVAQVEPITEPPTKPKRVRTQSVITPVTTIPSELGATTPKKSPKMKK